MAAVNQRGSTLEYADDALKSDRDVVMAAVNQDGNALEYADDVLKGDREITLAAAKKSYEAIYSISKELWGDRDITFALILHHIRRGSLFQTFLFHFVKANVIGFRFMHDCISARFVVPVVKIFLYPSMFTKHNSL